MAKDNVVIFDGMTTLDIPPSRVIDALNQEEFETIVVVGLTKDEMIYKASNTSDAGRILLLLEQMKVELINQTLADE